MKFVPGSPLTDAELCKLSQSFVDVFGEDARDVVNKFIDNSNRKGDFDEHATWTNVSLGVLGLLRPEKRIQEA